MKIHELNTLIKTVLTEMTAAEKTAKLKEIDAKIKSLTVQLTEAKKQRSAIASQAISAITTNI
jgi:hypothetical protein